jgi:hypothetical protein
MASAGYPSSGRRVLVQPRERGTLGHLFRRRSSERELVGYGIGEIGGHNIYLCKDGLIRVSTNGWFESGMQVCIGYRRRWSTVKSHHLSGSGGDVFDYDHHDEFVEVPLGRHLADLLFSAAAVNDSQPASR